MIIAQSADVAEVPETQARSAWLGVLSRARAKELEALAGKVVDGLQFAWLRRPHMGLVMVRGRACGTGKAFNLGEMTVTRCTLRLDDGTIGHGYVQGRDKRHAELAALLDALLQIAHRRDDLLRTVIDPLRRIEAERRLATSRKAASTKVEFFTMVRGESLA